MNSKQGENLEKQEDTARDNLEAILEEMEENSGEEQDLQNILEEKQKEYDDVYSQFQRLQADFTNYKRRVEKEKSDIYIYANEKIALDLLSIIDNLERALESQTTSENNCLLEGVELVFKQLLETLSKHGVKEIEALNKEFDMNLHHAIMQEETEGQANCVIEVFQKGYTLNDRVLRPAMVKVSK